MNGILSGLSLLVGAVALFGSPFVGPAAVAAVLLIPVGLSLFEPTRRRRPRLAAIGVISCAAAILALAPAPPQVVERHQAFVPKDGAVTHLQTLLGAPLYGHLEAIFSARYPNPGSCRAEAGCWARGKSPAEPFAFSADDPAAWPEASRRFAQKRYDSFAAFRAGFANDKGYNWYAWNSSLNRDGMPVVAVFEPEPDFAGGAFCPSGRAFRLKDGAAAGADAPFEAVPSGQCVAVAPGERYVHARIIPEDPFAADWRSPTPLLAALRPALAFAALLTALCLVCGPPRRSFGFALTAFAVAFAAAALHPVAALSFPPLEGGNDGLTHLGFARLMLMAALEGDLVEALRGGVDVFYFQPGYRYIRAGELLLFGDGLPGSPFAFAALVFACAFAARIAAGAWAGWLVLGMSGLAVAAAGAIEPLRVYGLGVAPHFRLGAVGFAETTATALWLLGLCGLIAALRGRADVLVTAAAAACMAATATMRNDAAIGLTVFAAAVALLLLRRGDYPRLAAAGVGFSLAALPLVHNLAFGRAFVPFASTRNLDVLFGVRPETWGAALGALPAWSPAADQVWRYLQMSFESLEKAAAVACVLAALIGVGLRRGERDARYAEVRLIALTALVCFAPSLFVYWDNTGQRRYEIIGASTSLIALLAWASALNRSTLRPAPRRLSLAFRSR